MIHYSKWSWKLIDIVFQIQNNNINKNKNWMKFSSIKHWKIKQNIHWKNNADEKLRNNNSIRNFKIE